MIIGFTGSRDGLDGDQVAQLRLILPRLTGFGPDEFHHGGQRGADVRAADIARACGYQIHWHPCPGVVRPAKDPHVHDVWHEVFPPLTRNRHIAAVCEILIAGPLTNFEVTRSGTWATVRYVRAETKPIVMLTRRMRQPPAALSRGI